MRFLISIFLIFLISFAHSKEQSIHIKNNLLKQNIIKSFKGKKGNKDFVKIDEIINFVNEYDQSNDFKAELFTNQPFKIQLSKEKLKLPSQVKQTKTTKSLNEDLESKIIEKQKTKLKQKSNISSINKKPNNINFLDFNTNSNDSVQFSANTVLVDQENNFIKATGNVQIIYKKISLTCEKILFNKEKNTVTAEGNVLFKQQSGNFHYGDKVILNNEFSEFFMSKIYTKLSDSSQMKAENLSYKNSKELAIYEDAKYTPCNCDFKNDEKPIWYFTAKKSIINEQSHTIRHENVTMYLFDLPIFYTPAFAHPDWTVKRRTGFLAPNIRISEDSGATVSQPFYITPSIDQDYTVTPTIYSKSGFLVDLEYRKAFPKGALKTNLVTGEVNTLTQDNEGVIAGFIDFNYDLENNWKTEIKLQDTSEDSFLRKYKLTDETIIKSNVSAEKVSDLKFSQFEIYQIGSLSRQTENDNSPLVAPSIKHEQSFNLPFDNSFGQISMSTLILQDDDGVDMARYSNILKGKKIKPILNGVGYLETALSFDLYDITSNPNGNIGNINSLNSYLTLGWENYSYTNFFNNLTVLKPQMQFVTINGTDNVNVLPNRDSVDYRLDSSNLFLPHRPQGRDLTLPGGRIDYGLASYYSNKSFGNLSGFLGQSINVWGKNERTLISNSSNKNIIPESDYLARLAVQFSNSLSSDWSARLDPQTLELNESVTSISNKMGFFDVSASHAAISEGYLKDTLGAEIFEINLETFFSQDWKLSTSQNYDLFKGETKLLKTQYGLSYSGALQNCMVIELNYERETKSDISIAPITEISLIFQFKYLGDIIEKI